MYIYTYARFAAHILVKFSFTDSQRGHPMRKVEISLCYDVDHQGDERDHNVLGRFLSASLFSLAGSFVCSS